MRHIIRNELYEYLGENKFRNIRTGVEGIVDDEKARKIFLFNVEITQLFHDYPQCKELVKRLNLKIDK